MEYPKTTKNVGQPCVICGQPASAQATVEALQAIIKQMGEQACVLAKDGMAAKAQVEALQRERDEARDFLNTVTNDLNEQAGELSQLQALVRALPVYQRVSIRYEKDEHDFETWRIWTDSNPFAECATEDEANGLKAMLEYRATLDATTPAKGSCLHNLDARQCRVLGCPIYAALPDEGGDGE